LYVRQESAIIMMKLLGIRVQNYSPRRPGSRDFEVVTQEWEKLNIQSPICTVYFILSAGLHEKKNGRTWGRRQM
jgi:hypothetical protein